MDTPDPGALLQPAELDVLEHAMARNVDPHGHRGANRAVGRVNQLGVNSDLDAIALFLREYADSPHTRRAYTKECERLLLWALLARGKPLSALNREDFQDYLDFLKDPQPAARWVYRRTRRWIAGLENPDWRPYTKRLADGTVNPHWRPFQGRLSASSQQAAIAALNSLLNYLVDAGYLDGNPLRLMRRKHKIAPVALMARQRRVLTEAHWTAVEAALDNWPVTTARDAKHALRARWLISLFYYLGLRSHEAAVNTMGSFFEEIRDGQSRWWFRALGKGNKVREIPVPDRLLDELRMYRQCLSLPPRPIPGEETPLLLSLNATKTITASRLYAIFKEVFRRASFFVEPAKRSALESASTHWLRHTYATTLWDREADPRHIKENLGHASFDTTMTYAHGEDTKRHEEARTLGQAADETADTGAARRG